MGMQSLDQHQYYWAYIFFRDLLKSNNESMICLLLESSSTYRSKKRADLDLQ